LKAGVCSRNEAAVAAPIAEARITGIALNKPIPDELKIETPSKVVAPASFIPDSGGSEKS